MDNSGSPIQVTLTDQEIQRITAEERLRNRLRSEFDLAVKEKPHSRWWGFLNSHFGLFLLSSVLLSGLTGLYAQAQHYSRQVELQNAEILKVTSELKYRLNEIKRYSMQMKAAAVGNKGGADRFIWHTLYASPEVYRASTPEFSGVSTYGVVNKLRLLGVTEGTDRALQSVFALMNRDQTEPDAKDIVYAQGFLDSHVQILSDYADHVLVPYLDKQRNKSWLQKLLF